jgi:hypothetical protein
MSSAWTAHVKDYAKKNSVSYKEAMTAAKATYTKATKAKEPKAHESGEAKAPVKRKSKKDEPKNDMPEVLAKGEKKDKLVVKHESGKRVSSAEAKGKKKKGMLMQ